MRGRRCADVDEVERSQGGELLPPRQQREAVDGRDVRGAVHDGDDLDPVAQAGRGQQRGEVGLPRGAARPDDGPAVAPRLR